MAKKNHTFLSLLQAMLADRTKTIGDWIQFLNNYPNSTQKLLSASDCAEILDLSRSHVYRLLQKGTLKGFKKKQFWQIKLEYIENYIQNHRIFNAKTKRNSLNFLNGGCI